MSLDATRWAWTRTGLRPIHKLILLALSDRAGADDQAFPSYEQLGADTGADRKTIWQGLKHLQEYGLISDSGHRKGNTGQITVWQLHGVEHRHPSKELQKRNYSKNGTVPKTDRNSSENGMGKSSVFGPETVPKTEYGTYQGTYQRNRSGTNHKKNTRGHDSIDIPDWLNLESWNSFVEHRKNLKAPLTDHAKKLAISKLAELRESGNDPDHVIAQSILNGWKGLFEHKSSKRNGSVHETNSRPDNSAPGKVRRAIAERDAREAAERIRAGGQVSNDDCIELDPEDWSATH